MEATQGNVRGSPVLISLRGAERRRRAPAWAGLASVTAQAASWRARPGNGLRGPLSGWRRGADPAGRLPAPAEASEPRLREHLAPAGSPAAALGATAPPAGSCLRPLPGAGCACTRRPGSRGPQEGGAGGEAEGVSPMESLLEAERPHPRGLRAGNAPQAMAVAPPLGGCSP